MHRPLFFRHLHPFLMLSGIFTALSFWSCKLTETRPVSIPAGFDWQGHRGCRGILPENSLPAFQKALEYPGVMTLELDLAVSKDHQLIVSHEPWFNAAICLLPDGSRIAENQEQQLLLYQLSAAEIRAYDCGSLGNVRFPEQQKMKVYKPTLREVVEAIKKTHPDIRWNIEIKSAPDWDGVRHPRIEEFVALVVAEIHALGIEKHCNVQSFDIRALQALHRQAPHLELAFLIENQDGFDKNLEKLGFTPGAYSPYYLMVTRELVAKCRAKNMKLVPWTVNDVPAMRRLIRLGVDGIITDYPDKIAQVGKRR